MSRSMVLQFHQLLRVAVSGLTKGSHLAGLMSCAKPRAWCSWRRRNVRRAQFWFSKKRASSSLGAAESAKHAAFASRRLLSNAALLLSFVSAIFYSPKSLVYYIRIISELDPYCPPTDVRVTIFIFDFIVILGDYNKLSLVTRI